MDEKYIIMNKRYNILTIMGIIIYICAIPIAIDNPSHLPIYFIIILCFVIWSIRLLFLPKCKAVEITNGKIIIYEYHKKHGHKIKYDIKISDITRYYIGSRGSARAGVNVLVIYLDKKRITLSPFVFNMKNIGLINYDVRKIKKILDYEKKRS